MPLWETAPLTTFGHEPECVELHVAVPREDGARTSVLYEDDGLTLAHLRGDALETRVELERTGNVVSLRGVTTGRRFAGFRRKSLRIVFRGDEPVRLRLDGTPVALERGALSFAHEDAPFELTCELA